MTPGGRRAVRQLLSRPPLAALAFVLIAAEQAAYAVWQGIAWAPDSDTYQTWADTLLRVHFDVPAFLRDSLAIRRQAVRSPGARSLMLRARPLARHFTTVSWWDDEAAVRAFARTDPHRSAMRRWGPGLREFSNRSLPGTAGVVPTVAAAEAAPT